MELENFLSNSRRASLFLPAHGQGKGLPNGLKKILKNRPGIWDIPELPEFGGPLIKKGAVATSQKDSAMAMGVDRCWYGVNGATGLLQAGLLAMCKPKQFVLLPRNSHRSLIQACALGDLNPVLYDLPFSCSRGHYLPPDEQWLKEIIATINNKGIRLSAAVLVNPTYQGYSSSLKALISLLHQIDLPVLVDEAHGTYFSSISDRNIPQSAIACGADLVVNSLHKSANGLVQTAVLWLKEGRVDTDLLEKSLGLLQTTSPSSLLIASCEATLRELKSDIWNKNLLLLIEQSREIASELIENGVPLIKNQDPLKLVIHTSKVGITGFEVDASFISRGVYAELPEPGCITLCLGLSSHKGISKLLQKNWKKVLNEFRERETLPPFCKPPLDLLMIPKNSVCESWRANSKPVPLGESHGEISAELVCPYPPGIPLLIPGEVLDERRIDWLVKQRILWPEHIPSEIFVVS